MTLKITTIPARLNFRFPFRIAHGERTFTDVVFLKLEYNGFVAFGEATLPPYLPDRVEDIINFFAASGIVDLIDVANPEATSDAIGEFVSGVMPAKAALDMALWSLRSKLVDKKVQELLNVPNLHKCPHTYTIGVCSPDEFTEKLNHGMSSGFQFFKLKMDGIHDDEMLKTYRKYSDMPFAIDANQAWSDLEYAKNFCRKLADSGCIMIEQPFIKSDSNKTQELRSTLNIPVIADEACQGITDIEGVSQAFDGINIKLQKCGGITEALRMIRQARSSNMQVLIGCMSESSVGCNAAEVLSPMCDWADLDGPWLVSNNTELMKSIGYN